jgi:hypothetical protein
VAAVARLCQGRPARNKDVAAALGLKRDHGHFLLRQALRHGLLEHERYRGWVPAHLQFFRLLTLRPVRRKQLAASADYHEDRE